MKDLTQLPDDLPVPEDDGACNHLPGQRLPSLFLPGTGDGADPSTLPGALVLYCYPMIGDPEAPPLEGWNRIPGARGCTPQSCAFRDHRDELARLGATVFGISAQPLEEQKAAVQRLHLPFELLNDSELRLTRALRLPTFRYRDQELIRRLTLVVSEGVIQKVFYPVFPPDHNAADVIHWLRRHTPRQS